MSPYVEQPTIPEGVTIADYRRARALAAEIERRPRQLQRRRRKVRWSVGSPVIRMRTL
jgi:hypothetical protein